MQMCNKFLRSLNEGHLTTFSMRKIYLKYSFLPRTLEQWNTLPAFLVTAPSLNAFKTGVCPLNTEQ